MLIGVKITTHVIGALRHLYRYSPGPLYIPDTMTPLRAFKKKLVKAKTKSWRALGACSDVKEVPMFSFAGLVLRGVRVAKIYDGDTVTIIAPLGFDGSPCRVNTRLIGVDACEIRGSERERGKEARRDLVRMLRINVDDRDRYDEVFFSNHPTYVDVKCHGFEKYGRELVEIAPCGQEYVNISLLESPYFCAYGKKAG